MQAQRCGAKARSGKPCRSPVVTGRKRCRMHGGAHGSGGPAGQRNGNYRHGFYKAEAIAERKATLVLAPIGPCWVRRGIAEMNDGDGASLTDLCGSARSPSAGVTQHLIASTA